MISWPCSPRTRMRPLGPGSPMRVARRPRARLLGGQSVMSGRWPSRVWMTGSPAARAAARHPLQRLHGRRQQSDVVPELLAEAAGLEEVALHVDDDQRG